MQKDSLPFYAQWFSWKGITWKLSSAVKLKHAHSLALVSRSFSRSFLRAFYHVCCTRCAYTFWLWLWTELKHTNTHTNKAKNKLYVRFVFKCVYTSLLLRGGGAFLLSNSCDAVILVFAFFSSRPLWWRSAKAPNRIGVYEFAHSKW